VCLMLYIGTAEPLPLASSSDLTIEDVAQAREGVRHWFSQPCVRFIGAHTGCSCGFPSVMTEPPPLVYYDGMPLDSGTRADDLRSVTALLDVLRQTIADSGTVELYPVSDGDESQPPKGAIEWRFEDLRAEQFFFNERFMHIVRP
jgi:hypothetical protein